MKVLLLICLLLSPITSHAQASSPAKESLLVYIDVRTWAEHKADNIEGDPRIHVSQIVEGVSEAFPDKNTPIRLYCAVGGRAGVAKQSLLEAGYLDVENVGGIDDARALRAGLRQ